MTENMINKLSNLLTEVPKRVDTGYYHSELFYGCESDRDSVYLGCLLYDTAKEENKRIGSSSGYMYVIEEFKKPGLLVMSALAKKCDEIQNGTGSGLYIGYIPYVDTVKEHIKKGCSFLSWTEGARIFTLVNLSFEPTRYDQLPGVCNEFINREKDPKLIALAELIIKSSPSVEQLHLFKGLRLLKKNIGRFSLITICNKTCKTEYENKKHVLIRFEGMYTQQTNNRHSKESRQIEVHLTFAPYSPQNTLSVIHDKTASKDTINSSSKNLCVSYHNKKPEYIVEIYGNKKVSSSLKNTEVEGILNEIVNHVNEHMGFHRVQSSKEIKMTKTMM